MHDISVRTVLYCPQRINVDLCALIENKHVILVEKTELGFETTQCIAKAHFFWSIRPLGILQPAKTKNEPNCHIGTQSTYCLICTKNKLKQEIDFIKKILLDNGYLEDIVLTHIFKKIVQFSTAQPFGPVKCPVLELVMEFSRPVSGLKTDTFLKVLSRSNLGLKLQVSISILGIEKSWSRNMRSLEIQNLG